MRSDYQSDSDSFNPTLWEEQRQQRMTVAFDFEDKKEEEDNSGKVKVSFLSLFVSVCQERVSEAIKVPVHFCKDTINLLATGAPPVLELARYCQG